MSKRSEKQKAKVLPILLCIFLIPCILLSSCEYSNQNETNSMTIPATPSETMDSNLDVISISPSPDPVTTGKANLYPTSSPEPTQTFSYITPTPTQSDPNLIKGNYTRTMPLIALDYYVTADEDLYFNREKFDLHIEKGILYSPYIVSFLEEIIGMFEDHTGLKANQGITNTKLKIKVTIGANSSSYENFTSLKETAMLIHNPIYSNMLVNFVCAAIIADYYGVNFNPYLFGLREYTSTLICKKTSIGSNNDIMNYGHRIPNINVLLRNSEEFFKTADITDKIGFGYRIVYYLEEKYGADIHQKFLQEYKRNGSLSMNDDTGIKVLKAITNENFFGDFTRWTVQYPEIFKFDNFTLMDENIGVDYLEIYPSIHPTTPMFSMRSSRYTNQIIFDFTQGFALLQALDYQVNGIYGTVTSNGHHILEFYDINDRVIASCTLNPNGSNRLTLAVRGAVKMLLKGDGSQVSFLMDNKKMSNKNQ